MFENWEKEGDKWWQKESWFMRTAGKETCRIGYNKEIQIYLVSYTISK